MKYQPEVTLDVSYYQGFPSIDYGGTIRVVGEWITFDLDARPVIGKTMKCFGDAIQQELAKYGMKDDQEFCDAVYAGFCEYIERLFSGRFNR